MKQYKYITLSELDESSHTVDENFKFNIYAYISNLKIRSPSTNDVSEEASIITQLELLDNSSDTATTCIIYSNVSESFSSQIQSGQIIRMHRAKVFFSEYSFLQIKKMASGKFFIYGELKVAGFAVLLFSGLLGDSFTPLYQSSATFTLVSNYEEQINLLRMSSTNDQPMALESLPIALDSTRISNVQPVAATSVSSTNQPAVYVDEEKRKKLMRKANVHRLNELILGGYSDIVVQVISLFTDDRNNVILRCWDTTSPPKKVFVLNDNFIHEVIYRDEKMEMETANYWCDIVLYEEHAFFVRNNVKCDDILLLINAHLYHSKNGIALTMHGNGRHYNRSVIILDGTNELRLNLLRNIDECKAKGLLPSDDVEDNRKNVDVQCHPVPADTERIIPTRSFYERDGSKKKQEELHSYWAKKRMRQIHATQLAWIYNYIWKKKHRPNTNLQHSFNLAGMAVQFIVRHTLEHLLAYDKDLFQNLAKLSRQEQNQILLDFLLTYMEGAYGDAINLNLTDPVYATFEDNELLGDKSRHGKVSEISKDENSRSDGAWSLLCSLLPGTVLKISNWQVSFSYNANTKVVFALICNKCNLWCSTSARNFDMFPLCPACFKRGITDSNLSLQCYFFFSGTPDEEARSKKYQFLFPIQLLAFFLVDVPESPLEAARIYRRGLSNNQKKALAASVQEKMLSKYLFSLNEIIVRMIEGDVATLEIGKLTFADRLIV